VAGVNDASGSVVAGWLEDLAGARRGTGVEYRFRLDIEQLI
jgi:hypothetical protein